MCGCATISCLNGLYSGRLCGYFSSCVCVHYSLCLWVTRACAAVHACVCVSAHDSTFALPMSVCVCVCADVWQGRVLRRCGTCVGMCVCVS